MPHGGASAGATGRISFHYHFINGQASIPEVQANIVRELEYQSSLELDPRTFDRLRGLPLASEIVSTPARTSCAGWTATRWSSQKPSSG